MRRSPLPTPALCACAALMRGATFMKFGRAPATMSSLSGRVAVAIVASECARVGDVAFLDRVRDLLDAIDNLLQGSLGCHIRDAPARTLFQANLPVDIVERFDEDETILLAKLTIDGADRSAENAIDWNIQRSRLRSEERR